VSGFADYERYDALGLAELVRRKDVSPSDLLDAAIERVEARNAAVNVVYFSALILLVGVPATLAPVLFGGPSELIERGHVYIAVPPLYQVKLGNQEFYFEKDAQLEELLVRERVGELDIRSRDGEGVKMTDGKIMSDDAKMIGITPLWLTRTGPCWASTGRCTSPTTRSTTRSSTSPPATRASAPGTRSMPRSAC